MFPTTTETVLPGTPVQDKSTVLGLFFILEYIVLEYNTIPLQGCWNTETGQVVELDCNRGDRSLLLGTNRRNNQYS